MRFMMLYKPGFETSAPPTPEETAVMGAHIGKLTARGILLSTDGLQPSRAGARVTAANGGFTVTDGPFTEAKELVAGFAIVEVGSKDEAIELAKEFLAIVGRGESEIRQMCDAPAPS